MEHISPSSLELLRTCPQKYHLVKNLGLDIEGSAVSTRFGTAWHKLLYGMTNGMPLQEAWQNAVRDYADPPNDYRTANRLLQAAKHYLARYGRVLKPLNDKTMEQEFNVWIPGIKVPVKGIIDIIALEDINEGTGTEKWFVDYKSTSRLEGQWVQQYRVSEQFKCYYAGGIQEHPDAAGVLVDLFHCTKGVTTDRGMRGKTPAEIDGCHFYRIPIRFHPHAIEEWKKGVAVSLKTLDVYEQEGFWPRHAPVACKAFGSSCPFLDICDAQDPEVKQTVIQTFNLGRMEENGNFS